MPNRNFVEVYKNSKLNYGPWVARADAREIMQLNLRPSKTYRRTCSDTHTAHRWQQAHRYGQFISGVMGRRDAGEVIIVLNDGFGEASYSMLTQSRSALISRLTMLQAVDGTPLITQCTCCSKYAERSTMVDGYGGVQFCATCVANGTARFSDLMGTYFNRYDSVRCYPDQESVEESCPVNVSAQWARDNGYRRTSGEYFAAGVRNFNNSELEVIFGYHDGPDLGHIPSAYDNRKPRVLLGMELEVENDTYDPDSEESEVERSDIARSILRKMNSIQPGFVKAENDGSLDNGFELITGYTGLDMHEKVWKHLSDSKYFDCLRSHDTETCGLHVHVDKAGMTALHAAKLATFIHSPDNRKLMTCVARRYQSGDSGYAKFNHRRDWMQHAGNQLGERYRSHKAYYGTTKGFNIQQYLGSNFCNDRYSALNFQNDHTVEFRMFRGTTKFETIMACLEFAFAAWHFSKHTSMSKLSTADFMAWICKAENRKDTKYLRKYLKAKKFRQFYQAERIAVPKFKEEEPTVRAEDVALYDDIAA